MILVASKSLLPAEYSRFPIIPPFLWTYIDTRENPADVASRDTSLHQLLNSRWFSSSEFLWQSKLPSNSKEKQNVLPDDSILGTEAKSGFHDCNILSTLCIFPHGID